MNESGGIHPFWRAVVGAGFGFGIGAVACWQHSLWVFFGLIIMVVLGGILGVLLISGD